MPLFVSMFLVGLASLVAIEPAPDIARILAAGKLSVAMVAEDVYPLFYRDGRNVLRGHEPDLAGGIAAALGVALEIKRDAKTYDEVVDMVGRREADLGISFVSITASRAMRVRFSKPYLVVHPVFLVNRMSAFAALKPEDIGASRAGAIVVSERAGTSYVGMARTLFPQGRLILENDWNAVLGNVAALRADAALRDEIGVHNALQDSLELLINLKRIVLERIRDQIGIVVHRDDAQLEYWVNVFLDQHGYPTETKTLLEKYAR